MSGPADAIDFVAEIPLFATFSIEPRVQVIAPPGVPPLLCPAPLSHAVSRFPTGKMAERWGYGCRVGLLCVSFLALGDSCWVNGQENPSPASPIDSEVKVESIPAGAAESVGNLPRIAGELPAAKPTVRMTLQGDIKLDALVGYVSKRLSIPIEYDDAIANRKVTVRTPDEIPIASLPILLGSVLRSEGLMIVDGHVGGIKRIIPANEMPRYAKPGKADQVLLRDGPAAPVTQVFVLSDLSVDSLAEVLQPFLSSESATLQTIGPANALVVTDYADSVRTIEDLITLIDQPVGVGEYLVYVPKNQPPGTLAEQVKGVLAARGGKDSTSNRVNLFTEPYGNQIVIAGGRGLVRLANELLQKLDVSTGNITKIYRLRNTSAERVEKLVKGFVAPPNNESTFQSTVDEDGNLLIIRGSREVHEQVVRLIRELDQPVDSDESPIRFYKLKNASAIDVLYSLLALQEAYGGGAFSTGVVPAGFASPFGGNGIGVFPTGFGGTGFGFGNTGLTGFPNALSNPGLQTTALPLQPGPEASGSPASGQFAPQPGNPLARPTLAAGANAGTGSSLNGNNFFPGGTTAGQAGGFGGGIGVGGGVASLPGGARVSADISTNSLIVFAPQNVQPIYAKLIQSLDQRRPQVLIEAKIIAIDTSDEYSLGVEVSVGDRVGSRRLFKFTSFGLSEVDAQTGALQIIPGLGFNGTLVDPDVADVVVRALAGHRRARVLAAPKILVNDNSTGKLESVTSVPFTSVNASDTVATTSLGGNQQAGTIITVTPHINEDDHLQLDFDVEFSTFSDTGGDAALPPPRQIDRVGSSVTIPDGKTVVVGGLRRIGKTSTFSGLPWTEHIPVLRELTSRTGDNKTTTSFFLFIRPVVLRDSRFHDLRFLSDVEAGDADLPGDFPSSRPELIHDNH